jgi:hypothetical protein
METNIRRAKDYHEFFEEFCNKQGEVIYAGYGRPKRVLKGLLKQVCLLGLTDIDEITFWTLDNEVKLAGNWFKKKLLGEQKNGFK